MPKTRPSPSTPCAALADPEGDLNKPLGVAEYHTAALLPEAFHGTLPTIEELEAELASAPQGGDEAGDDDAP